jgi:P27 family predicted phage terminase small subunit|tara:strand:+ start:478 stop:918 length:441 start_codon:yes stop_codon:yes gene_type:complete
MTKPSAQHKLQGTHREDRHSPNEMETTLATKDIDKDLFINKFAVDEWERTFTELGNIGLLMVTDITALMMLCNNVGIYMNCVKLLRENGLTITTPNGLEQQRPEVNTMVKMQEQYYKGCAKFGLTPTDRMKISVPEKKDEDEFEGL